MAILDMREVTRVYRTDLVETVALNEFTLSVDEGDFVAVSGPSGSGRISPASVS